MVTHDSILELLQTIDDPEMPISIVDLGIVESVELTPADQDRTDIRVTLLPTFVGCPALPFLEASIRERLMSLAAIGEVEVRFVYDPPWSVDRISDAGRRSLETHGVTVPDKESRSATSSQDSDMISLNVPLPCPFCRSLNTRMDSPFGPTRCRMIYYCQACKNTFEPMKRV